jgi:hypothetical protein
MLYEMLKWVKTARHIEMGLTGNGCWSSSIGFTCFDEADFAEQADPAVVRIY